MSEESRLDDLYARKITEIRDRKIANGESLSTFDISDAIKAVNTEIEEEKDEPSR